MSISVLKVIVSVKCAEFFMQMKKHFIFGSGGGRGERGWDGMTCLEKKKKEENNGKRKRIDIEKEGKDG